MDKMIIEDLEVYAFHGVHQGEKDLGQRFLISAELSIDLREAGQTDQLSSTVNYAQLCLEIEQEFKKEKHDLIESAAEQICNHILLAYPLIKGIKLTIKKPWAPIGKMLQYAAIQIERKWHTAYIALGSNLGDKEDNIRQAIEKINSNNQNKVLNVSKLYETEPEGMISQDRFINGALELKTLLTPLELMHFLLDVEAELKRVRTIPWGPRTIDLDVLLYDDWITSDAEITIPHPRMHKRKFVLRPLNDIAPQVLHPILKQRIRQLLKELER